MQTNSPIFTVSELNQAVKEMLEDAFSTIWLEGEISNFVAASSGHWYFSLKDQAAHIRVALFKGNQTLIGFTPKNGMHVLVRGRVSLYPARGDYQLIGDWLEERGEGKLKRAYDLLKKKLEEEGLFDVSLKKALPIYPEKIGVITSTKGAAVRDILHVLKRRYPVAHVVIYPTPVQGIESVAGISRAIHLANKRAECDVLILARGGGSLEDLQAFNDEKTARAIFKSHLPIITGVGHEVDFTIADYVADVRAPTPSAAAEMAVPDQRALLSALMLDEKKLAKYLRVKLDENKKHLHFTIKHFMRLHPKQQLRDKMQRVDEIEMRFVRFLQNRLRYFKSVLAEKSATLHALSPLATMERGYAIVSARGKTVASVVDVQAEEEVLIRLRDGVINARVI